MSFNEFKMFNQVNPELDYQNAEVVQGILESGTAEELEKLRKFHNLSLEKISLFQHYARLRKMVIEKMQQEILEREKNPGTVTEAELSLGAFWEQIEPQVRSALKIIRQKGYSTIESGFYGENRQVITVANADFAFYYPNEALIQKLAESGVEIQVTENEISLLFNNQLNEQEIKEIWDQVADSLPDKGVSPDINQTGGAEIFREKYKN